VIFAPIRPSYLAAVFYSLGEPTWLMHRNGQPLRNSEGNRSANDGAPALAAHAVCVSSASYEA
jgi:hypothetical protein